jgi:peptide/nickel transport system permease protein
MADQLPSALIVPGAAPALTSLVGTRRLRAQGIGRTLRLWVPAVFLVLLAGMCFLWPLVWTMPPPTGGSILDANAPVFSPGHWLGADQVGNDTFSKVIYGGRVAFEVALSVTALGLVGGCLLGIPAGYFGGWVDAILSRVLDVLIAFPALVLVLAIAEGLQPSEFHTIIALLAFSVPAFGRISRAATLAVRELPFVLAARLAGANGWRVMIRHIVPNIVPAITTFALLGIGIIIIIEGAVDYLGYGIQIPNPSWGNMIQQGSSVITVYPQLVFIPSIFLVALVMAVNALGDALRERWGVR